MQRYPTPLLVLARPWEDDVRITRPYSLCVTAVAAAWVIATAPAIAGIHSRQAFALFRAPGAHRRAVPLHGVSPPGTQFACKPPNPYTCTVQSNPTIYVDFWQVKATDKYSVEPYVASLVENITDTGIGPRWLDILSQYGVTEPSPNPLCPKAFGNFACFWDSPDLIGVPTKAAVAKEAIAAANQFGFCTPSGVCNNANANIIIISENGHYDTPDFPEEYCGYHSFVPANPAAPAAGGIVYSYVPYIPGYEKTAADGTKLSVCYTGSVNSPGTLFDPPQGNGALDGMGIVIGHEIAESQTDPILFDMGGDVIELGWINPDEENDADQNEIADGCSGFELEDIFGAPFPSGGANYYFAAQTLYSNADHGPFEKPGVNGDCILATGSFR